MQNLSKQRGLSGTDQLVQHFKYIYHCAFKYTRNAMDAEDLAQETFDIAYKHYHQLKDKTKSKSWLYTILRNKYFQDLKKKRKVELVNIDDYLGRLKSSDDFQIEPNGFSAKDLHKIINKLNKKHRAPILLYYFGGLSYKEIAYQLNIPIGTVMSRLARAKKYLKKTLEGKFNVEKGDEENVIDFFRKESLYERGAKRVKGRNPEYIFGAAGS